MSDYSPVFANGKDPFSATAAGTIVGGTFVEAATAGAVQQSSLNSTKIAGIAAHDAASGQRVSVWPIDGMVHEITHTAGGSVGDTITSLASGLAASTTPATAHAAGTDLGVALTTATAGNKIRFIGR